MKKGYKKLVAGVLAAVCLLAAGCQKAQNPAQSQALEPAQSQEQNQIQEPAQNQAPEPAQNPDAVSSASLTYYESSSLNQEQLFEVIDQRQGGCTIATVNADQTPNLVVAVPGTADGKYIYFTWAENATKGNVFRSKEAMMCYYIYDAGAEAKEERNIGARVRLTLVEDEAVIKKLAETTPAINSATVFEVKELLPLG